MAKDDITSKPGEGQEGPLCEKCGEFKALPDKKICFHCDRAERQIEDEIKTKAARKQALIEERTTPDYLIVLLEEAALPLKSFSALMEEAEPDVFNVLHPLTEKLHADLMKMGGIIINTLGEIQILICNQSMELDGKHYLSGDFYKAILEESMD